MVWVGLEEALSDGPCVCLFGSLGHTYDLPMTFLLLLTTYAYFESCAVLHSFLTFFSPPLPDQSDSRRTNEEPKNIAR